MEQNEKWRVVSISSVLKHSTKRNTDRQLEYKNLKAVNKTLGMIPMKKRVHGNNIERCKIVKKQWFAYNPMRVNVGSICQWTDNNDCIVSPDYVVFKCDEERLNPDYMFQIIKSSIWDDYVKRAGAGSVRVRIYFKDLSPLKILLPPLPEQNKIASILTTVDDKISSIDQQIQQTEQLKKGLMEKLLTEGIGHTEFKDTKIGRIPKGWDIVEFGKASVNFDGKRIPIKSEDRQNIQGEYPYYGAQGIIDYVNDYIFDGEYLLIAEDGENVKSRKNDIAFIAKGRFWVNNHAHIVQPSEISTLCYLKFVMNFVDIKKYITGMAQPKLNKGKLNSILIQLPPLPEQKQIATILSTVDDKIEVLTQKKTHYQNLKKGLSQQLLTGQMRVKI